MAPERKRSARDYEQTLRRHELAAGRALLQALPADGSPGARELAAARRVLTQALFDLRRVDRDLEREIEALRSRGASKPARAPQRSGPGELDRFEAVRNAVEEVAERWEGRRDQLTAELERRQPRQGRQGHQGHQGGRRPGQPRQPQRRTGETRDGGEVSGRRGAARARPERPRSPRSRRSPG